MCKVPQRLCTHKKKKLKRDVEMGRNVFVLIKREKMSALIQPAMPKKCKDLGTFTIPCLIGECTYAYAIPFLMTTRTKIDVHARTLSMEFGDNMVQFNIFEVLKHATENHSIFSLDMIDVLADDYMQLHSDLSSFSDFSNFANFADVGDLAGF
ncbi:hypothetical protein CR513_28795, partial [Mucuna pruriens]